MKDDKLKNHPAYKKARDAYGLKFELDMLQEECAELILAASKVKRYLDDYKMGEERTKATSNFFEEIGDVENMIHQMKFWFVAAETIIPQFRIEKLDRLERRVDEGIR